MSKPIVEEIPQNVYNALAMAHVERMGFDVKLSNVGECAVIYHEICELHGALCSVQAVLAMAQQSVAKLAGEVGESIAESTLEQIACD